MLAAAEGAGPAAPPHDGAGSQFASIIHRQVAAERAARRAAAGEPEPPPPLATNMPARLRQGPGSQTAAAFYRQAAGRQRAREAAEQGDHSTHAAGAGEHSHPALVPHAHEAHEAHNHQGHEAHHQHAPTHACPVPAPPHHAAPAAHPASHARSQDATQARVAAAAVHGVDPELLAAVLAGRGAPLDAPLQAAVAQHLGADVSAVRVYTGPEADLLSEQAGRMAFTVGESLIFGHGSYRPATPEGQRLLAEGLAAALDHGPGAHGPTPRAASVTDGGGFGGHGEGVGAVRPLSAVSLFAGAGAPGGHATAAQLLLLIRQVYAHQHQAGVQPHALVGDVRAAERPEMVALHDSGAPAVVRVSAGESARRQTMEGWGTSLSWWAEVMGQPGQQHYQQVMEMLFGDGGLRLNIARFNVGGGEHNAHDDPLNIARFNVGGGEHNAHDDPQIRPGHADPHYPDHLQNNRNAHPGSVMPGFWREHPHPAHGRATPPHDATYIGSDQGNDYEFDPLADYYQTKVLADANRLIRGQTDAAGKKDVHPLYEAFANAAPDWMTRDHAVTGGPTGQDNLDPAHYKDYARYLMDTIEQLRKEGFPVTSLEPFNEPDAPWWTINNGQEGMHVDPDARAAVLDDLHALVVDYNRRLAHGEPPITLSASDENNVYGTALDLDPSAHAHDWKSMPVPAPKDHLPLIGDVRHYETNTALRAAYERDGIGHLNTHAYGPSFNRYESGAYGKDPGKAEGVINQWAGDPHHPRHKVWMSEVGVGDVDKADPHQADAVRARPALATDGTKLAQQIMGDLKGMYPSA